MPLPVEPGSHLDSHPRKHKPPGHSSAKAQLIRATESQEDDKKPEANGVQWHEGHRDGCVHSTQSSLMLPPCSTTS